MNRDAVRKLLESSAGKFMSIDFIKKDGTARTVTGKLAPLSPSMSGRQEYVNICVASKDPFGEPVYKNVNLSKICAIRMQGEEYNIFDSENQ